MHPFRGFRALAPAALATLAMALLAPVVAAGCATDEAPEPPEETTAPAPAEAPPADPPPKLATREEPPPSDVRGIDVSHYSGAVDWDAVRGAGVHFAYVKATEGVDAADPAFASHWEELGRDPSVLRGAYHFYVTEDDPEEQARFFLSTVTLRPGDLPPVVDIEILGHDTQPGLSDRLATFLGIIERETGARPIIYTSPNFWNAHLTDRFGDYPLWVAEYGVSTPVTPEGWKDWTFWQWEKDVDVPGIEKGADLSHLHPDVDIDFLRVPPEGDR